MPGVGGKWRKIWCKLIVFSRDNSSRKSEISNLHETLEGIIQHQEIKTNIDKACSDDDETSEDGICELEEVDDKLCEEKIDLKCSKLSSQTSVSRQVSSTSSRSTSSASSKSWFEDAASKQKTWDMT